MTDTETIAFQRSLIAQDKEVIEERNRQLRRIMRYVDNVEDCTDLYDLHDTFASIKKIAAGIH